MNSEQVHGLSSSGAQQRDPDPYRFPNAPELDQYGIAAESVPPLPAPDPRRRLPYPYPYVLPATDRRRLDLHAALTVAGIAPHPGDKGAIEILCTLDDMTATAVLRWVNRALTSSR
jgi:hypothetical protein